MDFPKFADLMEEIGFKDDEPVAAIFRLNRNDLKNKVFRNSYSKLAGRYQITSIWSQGGEVAFFAKESKSDTWLFPFHKEEVDFLAKKKRFKKI